MHERLIIDANYVKSAIPSIRTKTDLAGKRLYYWYGGTIDDVAVLDYDKKKDELIVRVKSTKTTGFELTPQKIKDEINEIVKDSTLENLRLIYDMEGKELIYNMTESVPILWFFSYPPTTVTIHKEYLVLHTEIAKDGKYSTQKVYRLVQDTDNLVGLSNFMNRSKDFILTGSSTGFGLNLSFLLTAYTFSLPLRTSKDTNLNAYYETFKRGDNKLDPERIHENFSDIILNAMEDQEEEDKRKKELIGGNYTLNNLERVGVKSFPLKDLLANGLPGVIKAEIDLENHSQKGFPVRISHAHISSGFLVLHADEEMEDYQKVLSTFKTMFGWEMIVLIALDDTEFGGLSGWLH